MSIFKDSIDFDATIPADTDRIGAFNIGATGIVITSTTVASDEGLDVNIINASVTVDSTDLDIRDLVHTQDSVSIGDGTATILDIQALDSVATGVETSIMMAGIRQDASGSPVSATGDIHPLIFDDDGRLKTTADISSAVADDALSTENPILTGHVAHAASAALTALSTNGDLGHSLIDLFRRQYVRHAANIALKNTAATVGVAAAELVEVPLTGRISIEIQNNGSKNIFLGFDGTVTTTNGLKIPKNSTWEKDVGEAINIFAISGTAGQNVRIMEAA